MRGAAPPGRCGRGGGVDPALIILDPGLGFAKLAEHNWALLTHLGQIASLGGGPGFPVLIGASRKRFLGRLLAAPDGSARPFADCDDATVAVTALAAAAGAWCARVHEVPANADAVRVGEAWREAASREPGRRSGVPGQPGRRMSLDRISLEGLRVFGSSMVCGSTSSADGQEFIIDAVLWLDTRAAAADDDLSLTVDYGAVADRLVRLASGPPVRLIETLAQRLADGCLSEPGVEEVEITVHKPHAPLSHRFSDVTVAIRRKRT